MKRELPKSTTIPLGRVFFGQDYDAADRSLAFKREKRSIRGKTSTFRTPAVRTSRTAL